MRTLTRILLAMACLATAAQADAPLIFCEGAACGPVADPGLRDYVYRVDSGSYPITEFVVGTNDLNLAHYTNVLIPPGWQFTVEAVGMPHACNTHTHHGDISPGPCYCLTAGRVRWWVSQEIEPLEFFTFGYDHRWAPEDVGFVLSTRREGPPPEEYDFSEFWDAPVGTGMGPLHGPCAPRPQTLNLGPEELVGTIDGDVITVPGYSVPTFVRWDGDDLADLVVGEGGNGEPGLIRIYPNIGTRYAPAFSEYFYAFTEDGILTVPPDGCQGAFPRVVYWDGDNRKDLIVGLADGTVMLFLNVNSDDEPIFDCGQLLQVGPDNQKVNIDVGLRATPIVVDGNGDNRKDLIVGALDGKIHVFLNVGTNAEPDFIAEVIVMRPDGNELIVPSERSSPDIRDFNGDGILDILSGNTEGQLVLYPGPNFEDYWFVESDGVPIDLPGTPRSRPDSCFWRNDGLLDMLVGSSDGLVRLYQGTGLLGDLNCDGFLDFDDIDPFVVALRGPAFYSHVFPHCDYMLADCNADGVVDFDDIDAFVELLGSLVP